MISIKYPIPLLVECILVMKQEVSKKETTFHLPKDLVIALKTRAVQESRPYSAVVQEAIEKYLKEIVKPVGHV
jgi:predicted DNA binding CopG/RHH family protein